MTDAIKEGDRVKVLDNYPSGMDAGGFNYSRRGKTGVVQYICGDLDGTHTIKVKFDFPDVGDSSAGIFYLNELEVLK